MKLEILTFGKIREPHYRDAVDEYLKRTRPYAKIELVTLDPEPIDTDRGLPAPPLVERALSAEAAKIEKRLGPRDLVIALERTGRELDSEAFARVLEAASAAPRACFVVGSTLGLHASIVARARPAISLSRLTFPRQLALLLLAEQIYRGFKILRGESYHY